MSNVLVEKHDKQRKAPEENLVWQKSFFGLISRKGTKYQGGNSFIDKTLAKMDRKISIPAIYY